MFNYPEPWDVHVEQLDTTILESYGGEPYGVKFENEPSEQEVVLYIEQLHRRGYQKLGVIIPGDGIVYHIWERNSTDDRDASLAGVFICKASGELKYYKTEYQFTNDPLGNRAWKLCREYCLLLKRGILYRERIKAIRSTRKGRNGKETLEGLSYVSSRRQVGRHRGRIICTLREEFGMDPQKMFSPEGFRGFRESEEPESVAIWVNGDGEILHRAPLSRTNASRNLSEDAQQMVGRVHMSEDSPHRRN